MTKHFPSSVRLMEVAPRDGLQNEHSFLSTEQKINFIESLIESGIRRIEITSFVSPKSIPHLADHEQVAKGIQKKETVKYAALVPNMQGYQNAIAAGIDEISFVIAASDTHNQKNIHATTQEALAKYALVAKQAQKDKMPFRAYISCAFRCPYEGEIESEKVIELANHLFDMGAYELSISDTIGWADPTQTTALMSELLQTISIEKLALHFHDTRGMALANIYAALILGIHSFDSSAGGLGGCPYAPGASGNVATEDLVCMLERMGIATGIDLHKLCHASLNIEKLLKRALPAKNLAIVRGK